MILPKWLLLKIILVSQLSKTGYRQSKSLLSMEHTGSNLAITIHPRIHRDKIRALHLASQYLTYGFASGLQMQLLCPLMSLTTRLITNIPQSKIYLSPTLFYGRDIYTLIQRHSKNCTLRFNYCPIVSFSLFFVPQDWWKAGVMALGRIMIGVIIPE